MAMIEAADGTPLYFRDWGAGRPVVLIHGWPLCSDMWEYQALPLVEAGFRVITPDRRGFGRSGHPWGGYDYETLTDDVSRLLDHLDVTDAVVAGFSMGGGEVAKLAGSGNLRVAKAVLIASVTPFLLKTADHANGVESSLFEGMVNGIRADRQSFLASFWSNFFGRSLLGGVNVPDPVAHWCQAMALLASARATIACVDTFGRSDLRPDLAKCRIPTLVIHGTDDQTVPIGIAGHEAARLIRNATAIDYAGAPHGLFLTERERLTYDLIDFAGKD